MSLRRSWRYFLSGFLFLTPFLIIWNLFSLFANVFRFFVPELGQIEALLLSVIFVFIVGFLLTKFFKNSLRAKIIKKAKGDSLVSYFFKMFANYKYISEKTKKSFSKPVFVKISDGVEKIAFITDDENISHKEKIAIFIPDPVNFLGELVFVDKQLIREIPKEERENIVLTVLTAGLVNKKDFLL